MPETSQDPPSFDDLRALAVEPKRWDRGEAAAQRSDDARTAMCGRKRKHATERRAKAEAAQTNAYLNVYRCPFCEAWHVGAPTR